MSGAPRNADKLNTIGIVVAGICGAVLVYVSIILLQAYYANDSADVQTMADYGGQDSIAKSLKAQQLGNIAGYQSNPAPTDGKPQTFNVPIDTAMKLVVASAKTDPAMLVPTQGRSDDQTKVQPIFGRPQLIVAPPADGAGSAATPADGVGSGSAATPADGAGSGSDAPAAGAGSGSAAPAAAPAGAGSGSAKGNGP
jgi:hypothetical protein